MENTEAGRKSSILKPQKTRKPLRDIGLSNEDSDDATAVINKSCRRVSFASNNFVKPFVTDPEENTIWDRTYEEAIEQSDTPASIHSMQGENENDPNRLNMTIIGGDNSDLDLTPPVDGVLESAVVKDKTVMDDMEFTTAITNVLVFNGNNAVNKEMTVDDMELTMVADLKVVIFDYEYIHDFVLKTLYGDQISSYFGSSMLAAAPDLLIGAPMYTTKSYEEGCVFVYNNDNLDLVFLEKICGQHVGGRFGTAIAKIGGRYKAVAISAPYAEEGVGIIYIYFRHDYGYEKVQQISGKSVSGTVMGFGLSISRGLDIDGNEENDIAVGSLYSSHLIVLRSRRILMLNHRLTSIFNKIAPGTKNLQFKYCFSYAQTATENIDIVVSAESDDRAAIIEPNKPMKVAISTTVRCEDFALVLKSHAFDSPLPLKVKVTHKLNACPECPVLYHRSVSTVTHEIPFITGCGDDNICEPDLKVVGRFANITELTMGTQDSVRLLVSLVNLGETAYLTQLNITLPVEISKFPVTCSKAQNVIHCKIPNRLTANIIKEFDFHFDVKNFNPRIDKLEINVTVDSVGSGNGRSHFTTVTLPVVLKSNVTLIGFSPQEYLENKDGVNFTHEYMVFNSGPSPLLQEILEFDVPESILTPIGSSVNVFVISPLADECFPADEPRSKKARDVTKAKQAAVDIPEHVKYRFDCRNNSLVVCKKYRCVIGELAANASLKFRILVEVKTSLIYDVLGDKLEGKSLFLIQSVATFLDSFKRQKQIHVNTVLFRRMVGEANIGMWVIIAVIGSILILTLLIAILFKLNFFARPMREKMKMEVENKNERECIMSNDIYAEDNSEVFSDIRF